MIDSHAHLAFDRFAGDQEEVIGRMAANGINGWIEIGADVASSRQAVAMAASHSQAWATVGVHPDDIGEMTAAVWDEIEQLAGESKVVGIGEVGFDYFRGGTKAAQEPFLRKFLELAVRKGLPVVLHMRSSDAEDANADLLSLWRSLPEGKRPRAVLHSYSGSTEQAHEFAELGFYFGISGVVTFKNAGRLLDVVKSVPLERLLIETDSPFLAPDPYRGQRNEPAYVALVARKIAELKGLAWEEVGRVTEESTRQLFRL